MDIPTKPGFYWVKTQEYPKIQVVELIEWKELGEPAIPMVSVLGKTELYRMYRIREWIAECVPPTHEQSGFG